MNEVRGLVLKKFCLGGYVWTSFVHGILLFHPINSHTIPSTQNFTLYSRCLYEITLK